MNLRQLVDQLLKAGVVLADDNGDIFMRGPANILTPEVTTALQTYKKAAIDYLRATTTPPTYLCTTGTGDCWCCGTRLWWSAGEGHWVCHVCHPPAPGAFGEGIRWCVWAGRATKSEMN